MQTATTTADVLKAMLTENTGVHMLDSGGAYGRNWERNQGKDFDDQPTANLRFDSYGMEFSINLYPWLVERLEFDAEMDAKFNEYCEKPENADSHWTELMEEFAKENSDDPMEDFGTVNTYNGEDALTQTIQYTGFICGEKTYILLQIHGGCDVRGGYTKPRVFRADEPESLMDNAQGWIGCSNACRNGDQHLLPGHECGEKHFWNTDDAGCRWYLDGHRELTSFPYELVTNPAEIESLPRGILYYDAEHNGYCPFDGSKLEAWA